MINGHSTKKWRRKCQTEWRLSCPCITWSTWYFTLAPGTFQFRRRNNNGMYASVGALLVSLTKHIHYYSRGSAFVIPRVYRFWRPQVRPIPFLENGRWTFWLAYVNKGHISHEKQHNTFGYTACQRCNNRSPNGIFFIQLPYQVNIYSKCSHIKVYTYPIPCLPKRISYFGVFISERRMCIQVSCLSIYTESVSMGAISSVSWASAAEIAVPWPRLGLPVSPIISRYRCNASPSIISNSRSFPTTPKDVFSIDNSLSCCNVSRNACKPCFTRSSNDSGRQQNAKTISNPIIYSYLPSTRLSYHLGTRCICFQDMFLQIVIVLRLTWQKIHGCSLRVSIHTNEDPSPISRKIKHESTA